MELRDLYYFETIADPGNLGRAGDKLLTQMGDSDAEIQLLQAAGVVKG